MICQPAIFVKGFPNAWVSSSVLVYNVTIRWLHFAHAQSICTRPCLDQKEEWPGDKAIVVVAVVVVVVVVVVQRRRKQNFVDQAPNQYS